MSKDPYPVIDECSLPAVPRGFFRNARRDVTELPEARPGTLLVFDLNGQYETLGQRHLSGTEPTVLEAVAVSLVDIRQRRVPVDISMPSASPADDFLFRADFRCVVTSPSTVAAAGLTDVTVLLRNHLTKDWKLHGLGTKFGIDKIADLRAEAKARVSAYCEVNPPRIAGMDVALDTVAVFTPADLRAQEIKMRDERWVQKLRTLQRTGEQTDVEYVTSLLKDPQQALALAVSRRDTTAGHAADQEFLESADRSKKLLELIQVLQGAGHLDRIPVDAKFLVAALSEALTGRAPAVEPARIESDVTRGRLSIGGGDGSDDARFVPDEDDLVE